jgi:mannose-6-phosphate isomerase-like protein (cupin superfamily)
MHDPLPTQPLPNSVATPDDAGYDHAGYEVIDFAEVPAVACPCGWARRALADVADFPGTLHVTEITADERMHYHRRLTETYFVLECQPGAQLQLDDQRIDLRPGVCVLIRPGVRHRAIGTMRVLILALPKFDPEDEWFD